MRAARTDENQKEIVAALRKVGASVFITSSVGHGFPDLVVGFRNRNILMELKDPKQPPSKQRLKPDQIEFHQAWGGEVYVVRTVEEAIEIVMKNPSSDVRFGAKS